MMLRLFVFFVISNFSVANAMMLDKEEIQYETKKIEINELRHSKSEREELVNRLTCGFFEKLKDDCVYDLKAIRNYYDTGYNFGDEELNHTSLYNWIVYTKSLYALYMLGSQEDGEKLQEEFDRARRRLDIIDCYTDGRDYKYCLSGIWSIVSTFDQKERNGFMEALEKGEIIHKDQTLFKLFKSFDE